MKKNKAWMIGIICIVLAAAVLFLYGFDLNWRIDKSWVTPIFLYYLLILIGAVLGLASGVKELKNQSKTLSVIGIITSILAIVLSILIGLWIELSIFAVST